MTKFAHFTHTHTYTSHMPKEKTQLFIDNQYFCNFRTQKYIRNVLPCRMRHIKEKKQQKAKRNEIVKSQEKGKILTNTHKNIKYIIPRKIHFILLCMCVQIQ